MSLPVVPGYEIRGLLAGGGMGVVYLARKHGAAGFVRTVAIKVVAPRGEGRANLDALFVREALLHSRIEHPNVVRVEDFGTFVGGHYLVLEYVDGWSLWQVLRACARREVQLPVDVAASIVQSALDGLGAVHELPTESGAPGAVHGDVSPANILLSRTGQVKMIDLGVAATEDDDPFTGQLVRGKAGYASREQAAAQSIDRRADLYSMGVVLWEALTARRLQPRGVETAVKVPPSRFAPDVPAAIDAVVMRALEGAPEERFASAREMRRAIAAACPSSLFVDAATIADFVLTHLGGELADHVGRFEASDVTRASAPPAREVTPAPPSPSPTEALGGMASSALVGRAAELARLERTLAEGQRLVAISGPAGVGKTHFLLVAAEVLAPSVFVSLGGASTPAELERRLRAALRGDGTTGIAMLLAERAGRARLVLVLDGAEGLLPGALETIRGWCAAVPELHVVSSTRGGVPAEVPVTLRLAPLDVPEDVRSLASSPAFALWLQTARRHDAGYEVTPAEEADVVRILGVTEGLPLAIRVAAARTTSLSAAAIREELERSSLELDADDSSAPLRAAAESAIDQLDAEARRAAVVLAFLEPLVSPRRAVFTLGALGVASPKHTIDTLVSLHVLHRVGPHLATFSFFRSYLRQRHAAEVEASKIAETARSFLKDQAEQALFDRRVRAAAEEDMHAYREGLGELAQSPPDDSAATAWLESVLVWFATEQQSFATYPEVVTAARALIARHPKQPAVVHMMLSGGLVDGAEQERHALAALAGAADVLPLRTRVAIQFGAAWVLSHLPARVDVVADVAAGLGRFAADPEHPSLLRLKASFLRAMLLHSLDEPIDVGELVLVLHGMLREGDYHDVSNTCRLLVQCDEAELAERHVRTTFDLEAPCRTNAVAAWLSTYGDALLDLGRIDEAADYYTRTLKHRPPREHPNQCWRALSGLAVASAHRGDWEAARGWAELTLETTPFRSMRRCFAGILAWLEAVTGQRRPAWVEEARALPGRDRAAGDVWWALADHRASGTPASQQRLRDVVAAASPLAGRSLMLRSALRFAEPASTEPALGEPSRPWTVREGGATIVPPDAAPVQLAGKPLLARLVLVLAQAREEGSAGGYLSVDQIVLRCWPDERMSPDSAANRVRVCVARLRDAGLRPLLEGSRLGYRFRPEIPLVLAR